MYIKYEEQEAFYLPTNKFGTPQPNTVRFIIRVMIDFARCPIVNSVTAARG